MAIFNLVYTPDRPGYYKDIPAIRRKWLPQDVRARLALPQIAMFIAVMAIAAGCGALSAILKFPVEYVYVSVVVVVFIAYRRWILPWSLGLMASRIDQMDAPRTTKFVADENGISSADGVASFEVVWSGILRVEQFRHGVGVITSNLVVHIPNAAFDDDAERVSLIAFAKERLALQAKP